MASYLRVNLLGPGPRLMKKEFTGTRSRKFEKHWYRDLHRWRASWSHVLRKFHLERRIRSSVALLWVSSATLLVAKVTVTRDSVFILHKFPFSPIKWGRPCEGGGHGPCHERCALPLIFDAGDRVHSMAVNSGTQFLQNRKPGK